MERTVTYWTPEAWVTALWAGEQRRRQLYLSRDYRWATRQARIGEFESAWTQRTKSARTAHAMAVGAARAAAKAEKALEKAAEQALEEEIIIKEAA